MIYKDSTIKEFFMEVKLSLQAAEGMLAYLSERPYKEVAGGVAVLEKAIIEAKQPKPEPEVRRGRPPKKDEDKNDSTVTDAGTTV
jgi:hypothetical protein